MEKSGYNSKQITKDVKLPLVNITQLAISNYGDTDLSIVIQGNRRIIPKIEGQVPKHPFVITPDGTYTDYDIEFIFETGTGKATLDYKQLTKPEC